MLLKKSTLPLGFEQTEKSFFCDIRIVDDLKDFDGKFSVWWRLSAVGRTFVNCDFSFSWFDDVYLRDCTFKQCRFRGSKFNTSNLSSSKFFDCDFTYCEFSRTHISADIFDGNLPNQPNQEASLASTLETNFLGLGEHRNAQRVYKKAISTERKFLRKAVISPESYYREKYKGAERFYKFIEYLSFEFKTFVWGGGASLARLSIVIFLTLVSIALIRYLDGDKFLDAALSAFPLLMGTSEKTIGAYSAASLLLVRLVLIAMFASVLMRQISHR